MKAEIHFDPFVTNLFRASDIDPSIIERIHDYGNDFASGIAGLETGTQRANTSRSLLGQRERLVRLGHHVFSDLVELGIGQHRPMIKQVTTDVLKAINKAAQPLEATFSKPFDAYDLQHVSEHLRRMAVGVMGAHYLIWAPDVAGRDATATLRTATEQLTRDVILPLKETV